MTGKIYDPFVMSCDMYTMDGAHLNFQHLQLIATLVYSTKALLVLTTEYKFFTRDAIGLVYLPTQLERTLQFSW